MIQKLALVASVILPLWNIPLVVRIIRRRSSQDISIYWALGVWGCLALMTPSGLISEDIVWKAFNIANFSIFTLVVIFVLAYRKKENKEPKS